MAKLAAYRAGKQLSTVFGTLGMDENSATAALGWTLCQSPAFAGALLSDIFGAGIDIEDARVDLQRHDKRLGGYTDIEIRNGDVCHVIIEAKVGWIIPTVKQLEAYASRIKVKEFAHTKLVSLTAMDAKFVNLPPKIKGVEVTHRSWEDIARVGTIAYGAIQGQAERLWLSQLIKHLERYMQPQDILSSLVYVVPLNKDNIAEGVEYTWVDVVYKDKPRYFHPVGGRFPNTPQNYIGFRMDGRLQTVHFVERCDVVADLRSIDKRWPPASDTPFFVYTLGPAMIPAKEVRSGAVYAPGSQSCAIDTLLSGRYATVADAVKETKRRKQQMQLDH